MKGRLTKIVEGRTVSIAYLRRRFEHHAHLIPEFIREHSLDNQNEKWSKLSQIEIGQMFERYIAPDASSGSSEENPHADELKELLAIRHRIEWIEKELQSGVNKSSLQRHLKSEVLLPLEKLNQTWVRELST